MEGWPGRASAPRPRGGMEVGAMPSYQKTNLWESGPGRKVLPMPITGPVVGVPTQFPHNQNREVGHGREVFTKPRARQEHQPCPVFPVQATGGWAWKDALCSARV